MKKYTFALVLLALMPFVSAYAYGDNKSQSGYHTQSSVKAGSYKRANVSRQKGGYKNIITNNFYYGVPVSYSDQPGNYYKGNSYYSNNKKQEEQSSYYSKGRKFFLAHPFFQPLKGRVGSVTDISYAQNAFNFDLLTGSVLDIDMSSPTYNSITPEGVAGIGGKAETSQFVIKEDISYGVTDTLSLVLMAQYDSTKTEFKDWSTGDGSDSKTNSGLNVFGVGLQNRFVDASDWIFMGEGFFQHQKDAANTIMGGLKAGYKVSRTTVYGLGRIAYTSLIKGNTYGAYVEAPDGDWLMLSYNTDISNMFQVEGGLGAFSVLNKYFTLNGEFFFGHYDWHEQFNIKGSFGYQTNDWLSLNLYASAVIYDSAKGKERTYMNYDVNPTSYPVVNNVPVFTSSTLLYTSGDYKIKDYNEWKVGIQGILYF